MRRDQTCNPGLSRRQFLIRAATAATAFTLVPRHVLGGPKFVAPSEKINLALIGCGGQGRSNARKLFQEPDVQIIAVADPIESENLDAFYYKGQAGRRPVKSQIERHYAGQTPNFKVADYEDFRLLFEKEKAIDAVLCARPDHQHAGICVAAMRRGTRRGPKYASLGGFSTQSGRLQARGWRAGRSSNVHGAQYWPGLGVDPDVGHGLPTKRAAPAAQAAKYSPAARTRPLGGGCASNPR